MTELYDALEDCLQAMERGQASISRSSAIPGSQQSSGRCSLPSQVARGTSRIHVPLDVRQRGRSRLQQRFEAFGETGAAPRRRFIPFFPRVALTAILVAALVLASTGLVSASSASLPGDQLYPVKRTWESVRLLFVSSPEQRDLLQSDYEQERLDEISELLGRRQAAPITFSGILANRSDGQWTVSGIPVSVTGSTSLPGSRLAAGIPITVSGVTRPDGVVQAQQIQVLQPGSSLPPLEPSDGNDREDQASPDEGGSATAAVSPTPGVPQPTPSSSSSPSISYQFSGVVQSMQGNVWRINGQLVHVEGANIKGQVRVGSIVRFQGYYNVDGTFSATGMEPQLGGSDSKHGGNGTDQPSEGGGEKGDGGGDP